MPSVDDIEESGRHLLELINDILDLSKLGAGKLDPVLEEVVIAQVCQASVRLVKQTATQKRLNISLNIDRVVTALQAAGEIGDGHGASVTEREAQALQADLWSGAAR